jgi:hypothetical protein
VTARAGIVGYSPAAEDSWRHEMALQALSAAVPDYIPIGEVTEIAVYRCPYAFFNILFVSILSSNIRDS